MLSEDPGTCQAGWLNELNGLHFLPTVASEGKNGQHLILQGNGWSGSWLTIPPFLLADPLTDQPLLTVKHIVSLRSGVS